MKFGSCLPRETEVEEGCDTERQFERLKLVSKEEMLGPYSFKNGLLYVGKVRDNDRRSFQRSLSCYGPCLYINLEYCRLSYLTSRHVKMLSAS